MNNILNLSRPESFFCTIICSFFILSYFLSFEIGNIFNLRVRLEEVALVFILLNLLYLIATKKILSSIPISIWFPFIVIYLYSLIVTLISFFTSPLNMTGIIYLIRDIQYFCVGFLFYVTYCSINKKSQFNKNLNLNFNLIEKTIIFSVCLNILWGLYQFISGDNRGHYHSVSAIGLDGSSASSGISYFAALVFAVFLYVKTGKFFLLGLGALSLLNIFLTSNRTFTIAAIIFLATWLLLTLYQNFKIFIVKAKIKKNTLIVFSLVFLIVASLYFIPQTIKSNNAIYKSFNSKFGIVTRLSKLEDGVSKRFKIIKQETENLNKYSFGYYFGTGKGYYESLHGKTKMGMHSQFSRLINEIGLFGTLMWILFFIILIFKFSRKGFLSPPLSKISISFVFAFLSALFSYDVLLISKSAFLFWIFIFIIFSCSNKKKRSIILTSNFSNEKA